MHIRLKRKNQTIFQSVEPNDTFQSIKAKVGILLDQPADGIQLWNRASLPQKELSDMATITDQEIENDQTVYMCFKIPDSEQYEDVQFDEFKFEKPAAEETKENSS